MDKEHNRQKGEQPMSAEIAWSLEAQVEREISVVEALAQRIEARIPGELTTFVELVDYTEMSPYIAMRISPVGERLGVDELLSVYRAAQADAKALGTSFPVVVAVT